MRRWRSPAKQPKELYESLTVSDQALMREYYLEWIEKVDPKAPPEVSEGLSLHY